MSSWSGSGPASASSSRLPAASNTPSVFFASAPASQPANASLYASQPSTSRLALSFPSSIGEGGFALVPMEVTKGSQAPRGANPARKGTARRRGTTSGETTSTARSRAASVDLEVQRVATATGVKLAIASRAPSPLTAAAVTVSHRLRLSPRVVSDPASAADDAAGSQAKSKASSAQGSGLAHRSQASGATATAQARVARGAEPAQSSPVISIASSTASIADSVPASTTSNSMISLGTAGHAVSTPPSTFAPPSPSSSMHEGLANGGASAATSSPSSPVVQTASPARNAWGTPKSWAELAARGRTATATASRSSSVALRAAGVEGASAASGAHASLSKLSAQADIDSGRSSPAISPRASSALSPAFGSSARPPSKDVKQRSTAPAPQNILKTLGLGALLEGAEERFAAPLTYPRGMINKGNFCFANAILQVLVYCAPFYNLFTLIGQEVPQDFAGSTPLMEAVIHFLREFHVVPGTKSAGTGVDSAVVQPVDPMVEQDLQARSEPFVPEFVYDAMRLNKRFDAMRRGHQEDAEEFLGFFLDTLHEELLSSIRRSSARLATAGGALSRMSAQEKKLNGVTDADLAQLNDDAAEEREVTRPISPSEEGWMEVGQKGKTAFTRTTTASESPVTRIFGGKLRSVLRTPGAKDSVTLEPYQPLQLDIQPAHVTTIEDALLNLSVPEVIPGVMSPTRGLVDATKQVFIETLPPVLILHLKRFVFDEVGGVQKSSKDIGYSNTLSIADGVLSPTRRAEGKKRYRLFGVVYHHGRFASGGHYTADVLRQDGSEWLHIDDTTWHNCPPPVAPSPTPRSRGHDGVAYLLFYAQEDVLTETAAAATAALDIPVVATATLPSTKIQVNGKPPKTNGVAAVVEPSKDALSIAAVAKPKPPVPGAALPKSGSSTKKRTTAAATTATGGAAA